MTLSINISNDNAANNNNNNNSSGGITSPLGKRGPLSDLNSPRIKKETAVHTAAKSRSASSSFSLSSSTKHNKYTPGHNNGHSGRPSKDKIEIEATNESHASVSQLSHWLSVEQKKKSQQQKQQQPIHHHHTLPIRFQTKPRIKKSDVQATDEKRVSVKTLSTWMNGDPFEQRKVRTIRSGSKVITTSRIFEKDVSATASKECNVIVGSVGERQAWLCDAFKSNDEEEEHKFMRDKVLVDKQRKVWTNPNAVKKQHECREEELKSVKDKKEWLSKAFNKSSKGGGENESDGIRGGGGEGASIIIHQTKSFETKSHASGGGGGSYSTCGSMSNNIPQTKSFEHHHTTTTIQQTKSYEGRTSSNSDTLEREPSVVRLYNQNDKSQQQTEGDESSERTLKTVHDKQAWLSSAFKKPTAVGSSSSSSSTIGCNPHAVPSPAVVKKEVAFTTTTTAQQQQPSVEKEKIAPPPVVNKDDIAANDDNKPNMDNMTVAERARWLKGAFK